ncbi:hypothetical protein BKA57DRAFT_431970 [Linnemannia elongata]|nr:hypothetical protein BKA57DRAFT_431970 [Linnemannia elongata]
MRLVPEIQEEKTPVPVPVRNHSDTPTSYLISTTYKIQNTKYPRSPTSTYKVDFTVKVPQSVCFIHVVPLLLSFLMGFFTPIDASFHKKQPKLKDDRDKSR